MVSSSLLQQVAMLDRADQIELIDFLHGQIDDTNLDADTKAILDERLEDMRENPDDHRDLDSVMAELRSKWL
ncbi:MAG: addiction module protein [Propionibacteriaceae bacterium]|jgi:hypothetical protein|nr:addiction module protein [Propionibacteriaceae bacterium]